MQIKSHTQYQTRKQLYWNPWQHHVGRTVSNALQGQQWSQSNRVDHPMIQIESQIWEKVSQDVLSHDYKSQVPCRIYLDAHCQVSKQMQSASDDQVRMQIFRSVNPYRRIMQIRDEIDSQLKQDIGEFDD